MWGMQTSAVKVDQVSFKNIRGTSATRNAIKFACSDKVPCEKILLKNIQLSLPSGDQASSYRWKAQVSCSGSVDPPVCVRRRGDFDPLKLRSSEAHWFISDWIGSVLNPRIGDFLFKSPFIHRNSMFYWSSYWTGDSLQRKFYSTRSCILPWEQMSIEQSLLDDRAAGNMIPEKNILWISCPSMSLSLLWSFLYTIYCGFFPSFSANKIHNLDNTASGWSWESKFLSTWRLWYSDPADRIGKVQMQIETAELRSTGWLYLGAVADAPGAVVCALKLPNVDCIFTSLMVLNCWYERAVTVDFLVWTTGACLYSMADALSVPVDCASSFPMLISWTGKFQ